MSHASGIVLVLLSMVQIFLLIFTFGLARELYLLKAQRQTEEAWPLHNLSPGDCFPDALCKAVVLLQNQENALILCAVTSEGLDQVYVSLASACRGWKSKLMLLSSSDVLASHCEDLKLDSFKEFHVVPNLSHHLGLLGNTIIFAQNGCVVEATARSRTASSIRSRFQFVAG